MVEFPRRRGRIFLQRIGPREETASLGCDPAIVIDGAIAVHFKVLRGAAWCFGVLERRRKTHSIQMLLRYTIDALRHGYAGGLQNGRHDVDDVLVLRTYSAGIEDVDRKSTRLN